MAELPASPGQTGPQVYEIASYFPREALEAASNHDYRPTGDCYRPRDASDYCPMGRLFQAIGKVGVIPAPWALPDGFPEEADEAFLVFIGDWDAGAIPDLREAFGLTAPATESVPDAWGLE